MRDTRPQLAVLLGVALTASVARAQPREAHAYEQALAGFLQAYRKLPSPTLLLDIASTLRAMGRLADAANTYQRYLVDPATSEDRTAAVKDLLLELDQQLTLVMIHVSPRGSTVSIDGGPFVAVGSSLVTRVPPGLHLVRIANGAARNEVTINAFERETKDVEVAVHDDGIPVATTAPDRVDGWLITGTLYGGGVADPEPELAPTVTKTEVAAMPEAIAPDPDPEPARTISSGVVAMMRIDGKGRGAAAGFGFAYTPQDSIELELAAMKSDVWGAYAGVRYRFLSDWLRPYVEVGMPVFFFTDDSSMPSTTKTAIGGRLAAGIEVVINAHLSALADLGVEYYFNVADAVIRTDQTLDNPVFVPTLGVIGRL